MILDCDSTQNVCSARKLHPSSLGQFNFSMINMHYVSRYHVPLTVLLSVVVEIKKKREKERRGRREGGKGGKEKRKFIS